MMLVHGKGISFHYDSSKQIFHNIDFSINESTRVGLIGLNGCGKSTFFKILNNSIKINNGSLYFHDNIKIAHLPQEIYFNTDMTGTDYIWSDHPQLYQLKKDIDAVTLGNLVEYEADIFTKYDILGGYQYEIQIQKLFLKFNLNLNILEKPFSLLSGGEKTKLALILVLLKKPHLILLDEPTNHLDLPTINWLHHYLSEINIPFVVISHDRHFLDKCINEIWDLQNGKLRSFSGNYSEYKKQKNLEYKDIQKNIEIQKQKIKQLEQAAENKRISANKMDRFKQSRSIKKNGGICKRDAGSGKTSADPKKVMKAAKALDTKIAIIKESKKNLRLSIDKDRKVFFRSLAPTKNKIVFDIKNVTKSYAWQIFNPLTFTVRSSDKMAIIGKNGCGKTTLLKILAGLESPTTGTIYSPQALTKAYYSQEHETLSLKNSILSEILSIGHNNETEARTLLGCLGIQNDSILKKIEYLSSGEKAKVALAKTILSKSNVLILDEPTNHLEIKSKESIEDALKNFTSSVIFVSHDRSFINNVATHVYDMENKIMYESGHFDRFSIKQS